MKKLLLGSIALTLFAISLTLFDLSCKKTALAQASTPAAQAGLVLYQSSTGIGIENYDGTNQANLNIVLPAGLTISFSGQPSISPDHKTIFFTAVTGNFSAFYGYACNIDGSNVRKIDNAAYHVAF